MKGCIMSRVSLKGKVRINFVVEDNTPLQGLSGPKPRAQNTISFTSCHERW